MAKSAAAVGKLCNHAPRGIGHREASTVTWSAMLRYQLVDITLCRRVVA